MITRDEAKSTAGLWLDAARKMGDTSKILNCWALYDLTCGVKYNEARAVDFLKSLPKDNPGVAKLLDYFGLVE